MLLLGLADVQYTEIVDDYTLTYENIKDSKLIMDKVKEYPMELFLSNAQIIETVMEYLYEKYGTFYNYFQELGLSEQEINHLKERMFYR
jgi:translation initiation factor 2 alpha subunit (eIF-2alpha)